MATSAASQSLQRTNSNNELNVYLLVQNKINDELLIISREALPPTLRNGKLILNQKITFRIEHRNTIEGMIVYMDYNRNSCILAKTELIEKRELQRNQNKENTRFDVSNVSESSISIPAVDNINTSCKKVVKKSSNLQKKIKFKKADKHPSITTSNEPLNDQDEDDTSEIRTTISTEYSSSSIDATLNQQEINATVDDQMETLTTSDTDQDIYVDKINELSAKVQQLEKAVKEKNAEIKRLKSTLIEMPSHPAAQQYISYFSDKIRQQTTPHKYNGNLAADARGLGISRYQLNEILNLKIGITSIARQLFLAMVPEKTRNVPRWDDLPNAVLLKEKLLTNFMERFFGPLQVDCKKIHVSLVGCLRNERSSKKRKNEESFLNNLTEKDSENLEDSNDLIDGGHLIISE